MPTSTRAHKAGESIHGPTWTHGPRQANAVMKRRLPALTAGTRVSVSGQLQKTEAPDGLTGIASLTEDQSDASTWRLPGNYSRGLYLHIPDCRLSSDGRNRELPARPQCRRAMRLKCIAIRNPCWGLSGSVWLRTGSLWCENLAIYHSGSLMSPRREVRVDSP